MAAACSVGRYRIRQWIKTEGLPVHPVAPDSKQIRVSPDDFVDVVRDKEARIERELDAEDLEAREWARQFALKILADSGEI